MANHLARTFIFAIAWAGAAGACVLESDELGLGDKPPPKMQPTIKRILGLAGGWMSACSLDADARVACWGYVGGDVVAQPRFVPALEGSRQIVAAYPRACGAKPGGVVDCVQVDSAEGAKPDAASLSLGFEIAEITMSEFGVIVARGADGQVVFERIPVDDAPAELTGIRGLPNVKSLGGGGTCAISEDDRLWCWPRDEVNPTATEVSGIQNVRWFTRFNDVALTLTAEGDVWTIPVGDNANDTSTRRLHQFPGASKIDASVNQACVATPAGVQCWTLTYGAGNSRTEHGAAVTIVDSAEPVELAVGLNHGCLLSVSGSVRCWGGNSQGQLGQGSYGDKSYDDAKTVLTGATEVSAADRFSCAVADGLFCWGDNTSGQLGLGNTASQGRPVAVAGSASLTSVRTGWLSACALRAEDGAVLCWGNNENGAVGVVGADIVSTPSEVGGLRSVTALAVEAHRACAVAAGRLWCWGQDTYGRFGVAGGPIKASTPVAIPINAEVVSVGISSGHTCAIDVDTTLWCWGRNRHGEIGGPNERTIVPFAVAQNVTQVALDNSLTCFEVANEGFRCIGVNGAADQELMLRELSPVTDVTVDNQSCARKPDGTVWCWPSNTGSEATQVLADVLQFSRSSHSCWIAEPGDVRCAGSSFFGQLGDGEHGSDAALVVLAPVR